MPGLTQKQALCAVVIIIVTTCGAGIWMQSHADTPFLAAEAEDGVVNVPAVSSTDTTASGGKYVTFAAAPTPPPPPPSNDPVVVAAGDIACATNDSGYNAGNGTAVACRQKYTAQAAGALNPTAYLVLGDNQYQSGSLTQYNASYAPTWGAFKAKSYPVIGNHEYGTPGGAGYFNYFGDRATPRQPGCRTGCQAY
jgi:hypothetical protein